MGFGDGAVEAVGMLAAGEVDGHFARGTGQLAATGSGPVRQIRTESGTSWLVVRRSLVVQYGTLMSNVNCAQDCEAVK